MVRFRYGAVNATAPTMVGPEPIVPSWKRPSRVRTAHSTPSAAIDVNQATLAVANRPRIELPHGSWKLDPREGGQSTATISDRLEWTVCPGLE